MVVKKNSNYIIYAIFIILILIIGAKGIYDILENHEHDHFSALSEDTLLIREWAEAAYDPLDTTYSNFEEIIGRIDYYDSATVAIVDDEGDILAVNRLPDELSDLDHLFGELISDSYTPDFFAATLEDFLGKPSQRVAIRRIEGLPFFVFIADPPYYREELSLSIIITLIATLIILVLASLILKASIRRRRILEETKNTSLELTAIFNNSKVGIMLVNRNRSIQRANCRFAEMLGFSSAEQMQNTPVSELHISDKHFENFGELYDDIYTDNGMVQVEYEFRRVDGSSIWLSMTGSPVDSEIPADPSLGTIWTAFDVTERRLANDELRRAHGELEAYFSNSHVGIAVLRGEKIHRINQRLADLLLYDNPDEVSGMPVSDFHISRENFEIFKDDYYLSILNQELIQLEYPLRRRDGSPIWMSISGKPVDPGQPTGPSKGVVWILEDITEKRKAQQQLIEFATTDSLTGLANRRHFMEAGDRELAIHKRHGRPLSILMIDMDFFKKINDTFGHAAGDRALVCFAGICRDILRTEDIIGRIGGEEFAVLLPDTKPDKAWAAAERIRRKTEDTSSADDSDVPVFTVSIGIANAGDLLSFDEILSHADQALYTAKENGRNRIEMHTADKNQE